MPFDLSERLTFALLAEVDSIAELIALRSCGCPRSWNGRILKGWGAMRTSCATCCTARWTAEIGHQHPSLWSARHGKDRVRQGAGGYRDRSRSTLGGETDDEGGAPSRHERLAELRMASRMLGQRSDTVLLFDEMEDLFGRKSAFFSHEMPLKVHFNRMLETNPIPVIWTTNPSMPATPRSCGG